MLFAILVYFFWLTCPVSSRPTANDDHYQANGPEKIRGRNDLTLLRRSTPRMIITLPNNETIPGYTYSGCYPDPLPSNLALPGSVPRYLLNAGFYLSLTGMTWEVCTSFCSNYRYAGITIGSTCRCGNTLAFTTSIAPDSSCQTPCSGDESQACGAGGRSVLFSNSNYGSRVPVAALSPPSVQAASGPPIYWETSSISKSGPTLAAFTSLAMSLISTVSSTGTTPTVSDAKADLTIPASQASITTLAEASISQLLSTVAASVSPELFSEVLLEGQIPTSSTSVLRTDWPLPSLVYTTSILGSLSSRPALPVLLPLSNVLPTSALRPFRSTSVLSTGFASPNALVVFPATHELSLPSVPTPPISSATRDLWSSPPGLHSLPPVQTPASLTQALPTLPAEEQEGSPETDMQALDAMDALYTLYTLDDLDEVDSMNALSILNAQDFDAPAPGIDQASLILTPLTRTKPVAVSTRTWTLEFSSGQTGYFLPTPTRAAISMPFESLGIPQSAPIRSSLSSEALSGKASDATQTIVFALPEVNTFHPEVETLAYSNAGIAISQPTPFYLTSTGLTPDQALALQNLPASTPPQFTDDSGVSTEDEDSTFGSWTIFSVPEPESADSIDAALADTATAGVIESGMAGGKVFTWTLFSTGTAQIDDTVLSPISGPLQGKLQDGTVVGMDSAGLYIGKQHRIPYPAEFVDAIKGYWLPPQSLS